MSDVEPRIRRALGDLAASASADAHEADLWQRTQGRITRRRRRARGVLAGLAVMAVLVPALGIPALTRDDKPRRVVAGPGEGRVDPSMPSRIAAVTTDGRLLVLDSATGEVEDEMEPAVLDVTYTSVAAAPDGRTLATGGNIPEDDVISLRGLDSGEDDLVEFGRWPAISPDGTLLAFVGPAGGSARGSNDALHVATLDAGQKRTWLVDPYDASSMIVSPPRWSPDGRHLVFRAQMEDGSPLRILDVETDSSVVDARTVWFADSDDVYGYLGATGELLGSSDADPDGGSLAANGKPQRIVAMDAGTGEVTRDLFDLRVSEGISDAVADKTGWHLLVVDGSGSLHRWSEGEDDPTRIADNVIAATWIPDVPSPTTTTSTTTPDTSAGNAWQMLPEAPIAGRSDAAAVWTGTEMIVWGGQGQRDGALDDGAAYNPSNRTWRTIAPAPISRRAPATAVWTGTEMIVWGDQDGSGSGGAGRDGATYDPATDSWRRIAFAPVESTDAHWGIWTGDEMLVAGYDPVSEDMALAAYDPTDDVWREVAIPESGPPDAVWAGTELLVWFPAPGGEGGPVPNHGYALGEDGSWRRLADPPPTEPAIDIFPFVPLVWTGEVVVGKRHYDTQVYDPATDTYAEGEGGWGWVRGADVWTGRVVLDWGGSEREGDSYRSTGVAYDPGSDTVTPLPPSPLEGRQSPAAVWTGEEMLVWGGIGVRPGGMYPDTWFADGASYRPPAPVVPVQGDATDPPNTIVAVVDGDVVEMDASDGSVLRTIVAADEEVHATSVLVDRTRGRVFLQGDEGCDGEGNETVWQVPIDGGSDPVRVTEAFEPSVSPDGEWLAAPRHEDGCAAGALVLHEIESGGERIWRDAPGEYGHAEWAPDGRRLAVGVYAGGGGAPDGEIRVLDTQNRYATYADMPVLTRGFLRDSVVVDGRWILAVILRCDHEEDQECRDEVVTVDGDTGEQIDSFGEWLWTEDVDLDATGRHALVFAPESTESAYGRTVVYAVEPGGESRRIGPATDADW